MFNTYSAMFEHAEDAERLISRSPLGFREGSGLFTAELYCPDKKSTIKAKTEILFPNPSENGPARYAERDPHCTGLRAERRPEVPQKRYQAPLQDTTFSREVAPEKTNLSFSLKRRSSFKSIRSRSSLVRLTPGGLVDLLPVKEYPLQAKNSVDPVDSFLRKQASFESNSTKAPSAVEKIKIIHERSFSLDRGLQSLTKIQVNQTSRIPTKVSEVALQLYSNKPQIQPRGSRVLPEAQCVST